MGDAVGSLWWFIVSIGVLVTFHEFGHFWVARRCGVKVLRFSVGFGRPLWKRMGKDGTEYVVAMLPLGGYVRMRSERDENVPAGEESQALERQPVLQRIAISAAGPLANLVLCVALLWTMFVVGRPDYAPVVGRVAGVAALQPRLRGDVVRKVGDRDTPTWSEAHYLLTTGALDRGRVQLEVEHAGGGTVQRTLDFSQLPADSDEARAVQAIGLTPRHLLVPAVVKDIVPDSPAYGVLAQDDRITAVDGQPVADFNEIAPLVKALAARGGPGMVEVERDGERLALEITPRLLRQPDGTQVAQLGVSGGGLVQPPYDAVLRYGPLEAASRAVTETGQLTADVLGLIKRMVVGDMSLKYVTGPITTARAANATAQLGVGWFLNFLALLSLSLAILNLLPIPLLDGGHLLYYLIELVKGSPLSERAMVAGQYVGLALLAGLMGLALFNDLLHW